MSNTIVAGMMKEGKTTFAIHQAREKHDAVVAWDPRGMVQGVVVHDPEEMTDAIEDWRKKDPDVYPQIIVYRPVSNDIKMEFTQFCSVLFPPDFKLRNFSCIIDEAAQLQSSMSINPDLNRVVRQHPRDVAIIQTCHSLQDFHRASKDLMNDLYCFRMKGRSLDSVVEYCDEDEEFRETIKNLPQHHLVHYTFERSNSDQQWEVIDDPASWYEQLDPVAQEMQSSEKENGGNGKPDPAKLPPVPAGKPAAENQYEGWVN